MYLLVSVIKLLSTICITRYGRRKIETGFSTDPQAFPPGDAKQMYFQRAIGQSSERNLYSSQTHIPGQIGAGIGVLRVFDAIEMDRRKVDPREAWAFHENNGNRQCPVNYSTRNGGIEA